MKKWAQDELDKATTQGGAVYLGSGDFTAVDFRGRNNIHIGRHSLLGDHVRLGDNCEVERYSMAGDDFRMGRCGDIGEACHFGRDAILGEGCRVGRLTAFGDGLKLATDCELADMVSLPKVARLFGVKDADGRTLVRVSELNGSPLHAFRAGEMVYISTRGHTETLADYKKRGRAMLENGTRTEAAMQMIAVADFMRARFGVA